MWRSEGRLVKDSWLFFININCFDIILGGRYPIFVLRRCCCPLYLCCRLPLHGTAVFSKRLGLTARTLLGIRTRAITYFSLGGSRIAHDLVHNLLREFLVAHLCNHLLRISLLDATNDRIHLLFWDLRLRSWCANGHRGAASPGLASRRE